MIVFPFSFSSSREPGSLAGKGLFILKVLSHFLPQTPLLGSLLRFPFFSSPPPHSPTISYLLRRPLIFCTKSWISVSIGSYTKETSYIIFSSRSSANPFSAKYLSVFEWEKEGLFLDSIKTNSNQENQLAGRTNSLMAYNHPRSHLLHVEALFSSPKSYHLNNILLLLL